MKFCTGHACLQTQKPRNILRLSNTLLFSCFSLILSTQPCKVLGQNEIHHAGVFTILTSIIHATGKSKLFNELEFSITFHKFHSAETTMTETKLGFVQRSEQDPTFLKDCEINLCIKKPSCRMLALTISSA